ncbi:MAG: hypothetical protein ABI655_06085 [Phenylobacterium sp.]
MTEACVIIGAGPAAAAAARALVAGGRTATILNAGVPGSLSPPPPVEGSFAQWRSTSPSQWKDLVGEDFAALRENRISPKFSVPRYARILGAHGGAAIATDNFHLASTDVLGGLSVAWGAGVARFDEADLRDWPLSYPDLEPFYRDEAEAMGIGGRIADDLSDYFGEALQVGAPSDLAPIAEAVLARYEKSKARVGFRMGRARNALLSEARDGREPCQNLGSCLFGCRLGAIYSAEDDLRRLVGRRAVRLVEDFRVDRLERDGDNWRIVGGASSGAPRELSARRVILAAGAVGSLLIVLRSSSPTREPLQLLSSPTGAFAVVDPRRVGAATTSAGNALAALGLVLDEDDDRVYAGLFTTDGLLRSSVICRLNVGRVPGRLVARALLPAMLVGNVFFSGKYARNRVTFSATGLQISGGLDDRLPELARRVQRRLASGLLRLGLVMAPGGIELAAPGADVHYAGTLAHAARPTGLQTSVSGALEALPGVFVADGSVLPSLPAKSHTLTIMANARRIATALAGAADW